MFERSTPCCARGDLLDQTCLACARVADEHHAPVLDDVFDDVVEAFREQIRRIDCGHERVRAPHRNVDATDRHDVGGTGPRRSVIDRVELHRPDALELGHEIRGGLGSMFLQTPFAVGKIAFAMPFQQLCVQVLLSTTVSMSTE
jgi:hypothetical protein